MRLSSVAIFLGAQPLTIVGHLKENARMNSEAKPILCSPGAGKHGMTELHYAAYCGDSTMLSQNTGQILGTKYWGRSAVIPEKLLHYVP